MEQRPKLELEINKPTHIKLLFDEPIVGESQYGKYYLYAVSNGSDKEYSLFAPDTVHEVLKDQKKGTEAIITKLAAQRGKKLVTTYDVQIVGENKEDNKVNRSISDQTNPYLENMLQSFADAIKVQEKFNGMANVNQLAVTMFIQRTKSNGFSN
jgi:hypothetical protein